MPNPITSVLVTEPQRINHSAKLFGTAFPFRLEPTVYAWAERLSPDYTEGATGTFTAWLMAASTWPRPLTRTSGCPVPTASREP
jgi:hypothetical protein